MKILIAGCGYLGTALALSLAKKEYEIWGLRRRWSGPVPKPVQPIEADLLRPSTLRNLPQTDIVVLCQAPKRGVDNYEGTYLEGTRNFVAALKEKAPRRLIYISSTSVYGTADGSWIDEMTAVGEGSFDSEEARNHARILIETENVIRRSGIPSIVFRLGGLYGPGRHRLQLLKEGRMRPAFSDVYINRIRVEDVVAGIELLMERGKAGDIYLGADDCPSTQKEFYGWIYEKTGWPRPEGLTGGASRAHGSNKRCSNAKIKSLGLQLRFPSFREGYAELVKEAL